jgi:hypothetical protein
MQKVVGCSSISKQHLLRSDCYAIVSRDEGVFLRQILLSCGDKEDDYNEEAPFSHPADWTACQLMPSADNWSWIRVPDRSDGSVFGFCWFRNSVSRSPSTCPLTR